MKSSRVIVFVAAFVCLCVGTAGRAQNIESTKHNLSVSGPGPIRSTTETEVCIFCHTPHSARRDINFLWNRADATQNYTIYLSSTMKAAAGQPTGASKMCLSCHDGSIALGEVLSQSEPIPFENDVTVMPDGPSRLGSDISDDHPVSFVYDSGLANSNGELLTPGSLPPEIKLDKDNMLQCSSCHDPHDDTFGKFLVLDNATSALCLSCHTPLNWSISSHATSPATWNGTDPDPWPRSDATTVADNACQNCHQPHAAGGHVRLLNYANDEQNCYSCHTGNVAAKDIEAETTKFNSHGVHRYNGVHDAAEDFTRTVQAHVECVDCHNPHRANDSSASAPDAPGPVLGVSGINSTGSAVQESAYLYQICYKCHADNGVPVSVSIPRQDPQFNTRLEFDLANPSFHPVEGPGKNPDVPSLRGKPLNTNSVIYCTDCHDSDDSPAIGGSGAKGPHGSTNEPILQLNYSTADYTTESSTSYALCYNCHNRNSILNDESFEKHKKHIDGEDAPCSACHDAHGSQTNTHLINFDLSIVHPNSDGKLQFLDGGNPLEGSCSLLCHGEDHKDEDYKP